MECAICGATVAQGDVHGDWHMRLRVVLGRLAVELDSSAAYTALTDLIKEL
jgi:hypothetical protein